MRPTGSPAEAGLAADPADERWPAVVHGTCAARRSYGLPPFLRERAVDAVQRTLAVLFPHFTREPRAVRRDVEGELDELVAALARVLEVDGVPAPPEELARGLVLALPDLRQALLADAEAIHGGDPASESLDEVILAYPGFLAIATYRVAHWLARREVPLVPRLFTEWAHAQTGIDIHPRAEIGPAFAIDHGTGVVIGETTVIGRHVRIYQGVTLGALHVAKQLARVKRHPTIGDDVVIYANATVLGGNTVIGDRSVIGGNVWLTHSVPPDSLVTHEGMAERSRPADDGIEFHI